MNRAIPIVVGGAVAFYVWRHRYGAQVLRNAGLTYRPVGEPGEPYPDWVRALAGKSGVYVIRELGDDGSHEIAYVGESTRIGCTTRSRVTSKRGVGGKGSGAGSTARATIPD